MKEDSILQELILPQAIISYEIPHMEYETAIIESSHKTLHVKRKSALSDVEKEILLKEVHLREKRLFGKSKVPVDERKREEKSGKKLLRL